VLRQIADNSEVGVKHLAIMAAVGTSVSVLAIYQPIQVLAFTIAVGIGVVSLTRKTLAVKLMLLFGGIPLEQLGQDPNNPADKPILRSLGGTTVDGLILVTVCLVFTIVLVRSRRLHVPHGMVPFLVFLSSTALAISYSSARLDGLRLFLKLAYPVLLALLALSFVKTKKEIDSAIKYWIAGALLATASGITLYIVHGAEAFVSGGDVRYSSGLTYYGQFSMYMLAAFVLCYTMWRTGKRARYGILSMIFGVQAALSETRITWAAIAVAMLVVEATSGTGLRRHLRVLGAAVVIGVFSLLILWNVPQVQQRMFRSELEGPLSAAEGVERLDLSSRGILWATLYEDYLLHNHWLGGGLGSSLPVIRRDFPPGVAAPHNEYLRLLHDTGIAGCALFVISVAALFELVISLVRRCASLGEATFSRVSLALLSAYVITAVTDNPFDYYLVFSQYIFFVIAVSVLVDKWRSNPTSGTPGLRMAESKDLD